LRSFSGASLSRIAFPLGGIGTGIVSLSGRGSLTDFEWWGHPGKGYLLPYTFFTLAARHGSKGPFEARVLAAPPAPPYDFAGFGLPRDQGQGLPHFAKATFRGAYPFATVRLEDRDFPVGVELEAWNPLIPLDPDESGLPIAVLRYRLRNRTARKVEATLVGSLFNAVGLDGDEVPFRRRHGSLGGNRNRIARGPRDLAGIHMTRDGASRDSPRAGSLFLGVVGSENSTVQARWPRGAWFDDLQLFWDDFTRTGRLSEDEGDAPSPPGISDPGSFGEVVSLPPKSARDVVFLLAWHFPNFENRWNRDEPSVSGKPLRTHYGARFASALEVARHAAESLPTLEARTRGYHDAFFSQTLPPEVLDAVSSQVSTVRTPTGLRLDDGSFHAFEGCLDRVGCCPMDCTHVWNYAQVLPHLWPSLERTLRVTGLGSNLFDDGRQAFRSLLPLSAGARFDRKPAADGQLGEILKLFREWRISGDTAWLTELWPAARKTLDYAFVQWDADRDGVIEGEQHVTYDIELYGPNPLVGTLYLAALEAGAIMADAVGDKEAVRTYRPLVEQGAKRFDELCWNGDYYVQATPSRAEIRTDPYPAGSLGGSLEGISRSEPPKYQIDEGCLSDQLFGEWLARACGLGPVLPTRRVQRALRSIVRNNFRKDLRGHTNTQRIYALGDEAGLVLCSWPRGGRPRLPFPYADEVWTGVEYEVAAHLIWEGQVQPGLALVRAARERFDGVKRNPWDETECGHHYARAMSSWSLLHALSGFAWDGVRGRLSFSPRLQPRRFRALFTAGSGWGIFEQRASANRLSVTLEVLGGSVRLGSLELAWPSGKPPARLGLTDGPPGAEIERRGTVLDVSFTQPVPIEEGERLTLTLRPRSGRQKR
jgi:uncharacterized protein (DUF608 family)